MVMRALIRIVLQVRSLSFKERSSVTGAGLIAFYLETERLYRIMRSGVFIYSGQKPDALTATMARFSLITYFIIMDRQEMIREDLMSHIKMTTWEGLKPLPCGM
jgi:hypothetical protein